MKIKSVFFTLLPLAALPVLVHANPVDITLNGGVTPKHNLGSFGDHQVFSWLTSDISYYNSHFGTSLCGTGETALQHGNGGHSVTLDVTGCDYIFLDWDGPHGDQAQAYYVGDCSGTYTFSNTDIGGHSNSGGLSYYCCYQKACVPDGGPTNLMLGAALCGLGLFVMVRRFKS